MLAEGAQVGSVAAIQDFQAALANYIDQSKQALVMIDLEIRRAVDWVRIDRREYWKHEIRRAGDAVNRAKDDLHRCLSFKSMENYRPSCVDERKALQRAQERLRLAESKAEAVRRWTRAVQHELNEYAGRIVQFNATLDGDVPKALTTLSRILDTLDRYMSTTAPRPLGDSAVAQGGSLNQPDEADSTTSMARPLDDAPVNLAENGAPDTTVASAAAQPAPEVALQEAAQQELAQQEVTQPAATRQELARESPQPSNEKSEGGA